MSNNMNGDLILEDISTGREFLLESGGTSVCIVSLLLLSFTESKKKHFLNKLYECSSHVYMYIFSKMASRQK